MPASRPSALITALRDVFRRRPDQPIQHQISIEQHADPGQPEQHSGSDRRDRSTSIPATRRSRRSRSSLDGNVACSKDLSLQDEPGAQPRRRVRRRFEAVDIVCSINTAAFNATTGAVTYANGSHPAQRPRHHWWQSAGQRRDAERLGNLQQPERLHRARSPIEHVGGPASAVNTTTGLKWVQGNVPLKLIAVNYAAGGATVSSINASFLGKTFTDTPDAGTQVFTIDFPNSGTAAAASTSSATRRRLRRRKRFRWSPVRRSAPASTGPTRFSTLARGRHLGLTPARLDARRQRCPDRSGLYRRAALGQRHDLVRRRPARHADVALTTDSAWMLWREVLCHRRGGRLPVPAARAV